MDSPREKAFRRRIDMFEASVANKEKRRRYPLRFV
jgi:hypothetical protein